MSERRASESETERSHQPRQNKHPRWKRFCIFARQSLRKPDNLPAHLTWFFTLVLAAFAFAAWLEARRGSAAMEGQLAAIQADERPFMWVIGEAQPSFKDQTGQAAWDVAYGNIGKGIGYNVVMRFYMRVGTSKFEAAQSYGIDSVPLKPSEPTIFPPGDRQYTTVVSRSGISKDYFNRQLTIDGGVGVMAEFTYADASGTKTFNSGVCLMRLSSGAIANRPEAECPK